MSFWMREQTYFNQGFKGTAFQTVTLRERGQLIAMFDVIFGLWLHFDATAWKHARSPAWLCVFLYVSHTYFIRHSQMKNYWKVSEFVVL